MCNIINFIKSKLYELVKRNFLSNNAMCTSLLNIFYMENVQEKLENLCTHGRHITSCLSAQKILTAHYTHIIFTILHEVLFLFSIMRIGCDFLLCHWEKNNSLLISPFMCFFPDKNNIIYCTQQKHYIIIFHVHKNI